MTPTDCVGHSLRVGDFVAAVTADSTGITVGEIAWIQGNVARVRPAIPEGPEYALVPRREALWLDPVTARSYLSLEKQWKR